MSASALAWRNSRTPCCGTWHRLGGCRCIWRWSGRWRDPQTRRSAELQPVSCSFPGQHTPGHTPAWGTQHSPGHSDALPSPAEMLSKIYRLKRQLQAQITCSVSAPSWWWTERCLPSLPAACQTDGSPWRWRHTFNTQRMKEDDTRGWNYSDHTINTHPSLSNLYRTDLWYELAASVQGTISFLLPHSHCSATCWTSMENH